MWTSNQFWIFRNNMWFLFGMFQILRSYCVSSYIFMYTRCPERKRTNKTADSRENLMKTWRKSWTNSVFQFSYKRDVCWRAKLMVKNTRCPLRGREGFRSTWYTDFISYCIIYFRVNLTVKFRLLWWKRYKDIWENAPSWKSSSFLGKLICMWTLGIGINVNRLIVWNIWRGSII